MGGVYARKKEVIDMLKSQPKGLYLLFLTEAWERFGFYMVQTLLILYMTKGLAYSDTHAYLLYGAFSSMLYLTPVVGGYLADHYIGFRQSIVWGAILLSFGYALMSIQDPRVLFLGLSIVIIGNGFFKPNVSSIVGDLYKPEDPRRDGGFTIFYMGINLGALLPPLFAGALVAAYTWGTGFLAASLGMIISLVTFIVGRKWIHDIGNVPQASPLRHGKKGRFYSVMFIGILVVVGLMHVLFSFPKIANIVLITASLAIVGSVLFFLFKEKHEQRNKLFACLILILISVGFWALYNQTFTSLMLFADRNMSKHWLWFTINAEFTQFFNPFFIIVLSPILSAFWIWLDQRKSNPSTPSKFCLGVLFMSLGYLILWTGIRFLTHGPEVSPWLLVTSYFSQTIGELLLSPIGLAMVTRLSPRHLVGMMMGVWFLTQAAAFSIGSTLATISDVPKDTPQAVSLLVYSDAFLTYGLISLALAIISITLIPFLKRLIGIPSGPIPTPKR
jgi:proton-dependent oligopeptide transporter, POT family